MTNKTILLNNYIFDYVEDLIPEGDSEGNIATYSPQCLYDNKKNLPLLAEAENNAKFYRFRLHNAFENCNKLTIKAPKDSYAEEYAKKHNIKFEAI